MKPFTILWCLLLSMYPDLRAQPGVVSLSVNEGLSQGMIFDILQSRDGFLWIATKDGLNRYDGYRFEVFSPDPFNPFSIAVSEVHTLFEDARGRLWCGYDGGVDIFVPESKRFFHLPIPGSKFLNGYDMSFAETPDGTMWMAGKGYLWKVEAFEKTLQKAASARSAFPAFQLSEIDEPLQSTGKPAEGKPGAEVRINSVIFGKDKTLLAGTTNGLYRIDPVGSKLQPQPEALPGVNSFIIGEDRSGRLWLRSEGALWIRERRGAPLRQITAMVEGHWRFDSEYHLWNLANGILRQWRASALEAGGKPALELDLAPSSPTGAFYLTDLEPDRSGNVWIGTSGYGLLKVSSVRPKFLSYFPLTSHRMIVEDPNGALFSAAYPRMMYAGKQFDQKHPNPWLTNIPPEKSVGAFTFDKDGNCWVILEGDDLCRIDARTKQARLFTGGGIGLLFNKNGNLLTLRADALLEFDPATEQFKTYPFDKPLQFNYNSNYAYNYFFEDREGVLWIFAFKGLLKAAPTAAGGYRFEHFINNPENRSSLSNNHVLSVAEDPLEPRRYLWAGTKGGGLNRLDRQSGTFTHFKTEQGLPDNVVYGILSDKAGNLWLSTNKGLCRMKADDGRQTADGKESRGYRFKNFTTADGLQSNEFNQGSFLKTRDGTMIFGGVNGLTAFHPDSLRFNERKPLTVVTRFWVDNRLMDFPQANSKQVARLELPHHQNLLSLEFAALDFSNPAQNQFRYSLRKKQSLGGHEDENWGEPDGKNSVQFANLQPGSYVFKVLGSNNDGIWSEQPAVFEFIIRPPWWATWWAYLLYALALGGAVLFLYRYQLRQKMKHQETLRLRELDDFKNRFFTNITHEFRTPLTVILGMTERLRSDGVTPEKPVAMIRRSGENLLRLINQILDLAKLENNTLQLNYVQGDVQAYLRYIAESLHSLAEAQGVTLRVEFEEPEIIMDYDPERLLQIVHNLLSNAVKFTPSGGRVTLHTGVRNLEGFANLELRVTDTGAGIAPKDLPYLFDRFYQADNLEKAKAGPTGASGTGIGLALTQELVSAMGGDIRVQSTVGEGTTFSVRLPITKKSERWAVGGDADGIPHTAHRTPPTDGTPDRLPHTERLPTTDDRPLLLLIEDNPDVMEYLAACLGAYYQLDFAHNGRIGIEKALETVPDLIVSDVMMPEKDGFEVCDFLKNDERTSHIPIVLLTAKADVESRLTGLRRGADAYLAKPFHQEELLVTIANLLELRKKLQAKYSRSILEPPCPLAPDPLTPDPEDAFLQKIRALVEQNLKDSDFDMPHLERMLAMSRSQIFRKMKALTGRSPSQFIRSIRLHHGRRLLETTDLTVSEIAYEVGFSSMKYFSDAFVEEFGERPTGVRG